MDIAWISRLMFWMGASAFCGFLAPIASFLLATPFAVFFATLDLSTHARPSARIAPLAFDLVWLAIALALAVVWFAAGLRLFQRSGGAVFTALAGAPMAGMGVLACAQWASGLSLAPPGG